MSRPRRHDLVTGAEVIPGDEEPVDIALTAAEKEALLDYLRPLAAPGERKQLMRVARRLLMDLATGRARLVRE